MLKTKQLFTNIVIFLTNQITNFFNNLQYLIQTQIDKI